MPRFVAPPPVAAARPRWWRRTLVVLAVGPLQAFAADSAPVNPADRRFMDEATTGGMVEIVLGRVAQEKATNDAVRQFGGHMVDDHNKANEELKQLAAVKGVALPTGLSSEQKAHASHMKKLKPAAFDRQYMAEILADHRKTVALFDRAAVSATDADIKAFAAKTLPTLRSHLEMAQQTSAALSASTAGPKLGKVTRE